MKSFALFVLLAFSAPVVAQKNVTPVSESSVTGISLPAGSKKDSRFISVAATDILLGIETNKVKASLSGTEVLMLPAAVPGGFNKDSLSMKLKAKGWSIVPVTDDERYSWLYKEKRTVISYFNTDSKSTLLYFANAILPEVQKPEEKISPAGPASQESPASHASLASPASPSTPSTPSTASTPSTPSTPPTSTASTASTAYFFSSTNFDDGWKGTERSDWVEVVKGNITVLLHYPNPAAGTPSYDYTAVTSNAWNILVAGRYSNLQNFSVLTGAVAYEPAYFGTGDVTDNASGKRMFVALFRKGETGWIEIICPDRNAFVQAFGIDINKPDYYTDSSMWDPLSKLSWYNRFAVAPADLTGKWTNNYSGMLQYVNVYTGANAGMNTHSSSQTFEFEAGGNYKWEISVASGFVGSIKFQNAKSAGVATHPNNWQIHFSDLEGKPKTYNAYFSCIKGARILWLEDTSYPTEFTGYGRM
ncbi:MAG: hypothetical protein IPH69_17330 [Bacteroidales bacterium]|nr:hypothetical protein [Bacteroidales bacterium]